jgi:hypothetical protein
MKTAERCLGAATVAAGGALLLVLTAALAIAGAAVLWREAPPADAAMALPAVAITPVDVPSETRTLGHRCRVYLIYQQPDPTIDVPSSDGSPEGLRSLLGWMLALFATGLALTVLSRVGAARQPLAAAMRGGCGRPVPGLLLLVLLLPMLPQLVLVHSACPLLPALLWLSATGGAIAAGAMLLGRRRLLDRLRWGDAAAGGLVADGTVLAVEVQPRELVAPPGERQTVPWYRADLSAVADSGPLRVALDDAIVDDLAAQRLGRLAAAGVVDPGRPLTVLGPAQRVPADAAAADPLCRAAPMQPRLGGGRGARVLVVAGTRTQLVRLLRVESALLVGSLAVCLAAGVLALLP